jgi:hypothetical protein
MLKKKGGACRTRGSRLCRSLHTKVPQIKSCRVRMKLIVISMQSRPEPVLANRFGFHTSENGRPHRNDTAAFLFKRTAKKRKVPRIKRSCIPSLTQEDWVDDVHILQDLFQARRRKRLQETRFPSTVPMFVPSLSWQRDR